MPMGAAMAHATKAAHVHLLNASRDQQIAAHVRSGMQGARRSSRAEFDYRPAAFVEDRQRTDSSHNALEVVAGVFLEGEFHFRAGWALGNRVGRSIRHARETLDAYSGT